MDFNGVPKGKLIPMYLSDDGDLYSLRYKDMEQLESISIVMQIAVGSLLDGRIVIDREPIDTGYKVLNKADEKKN